MVRAAAKNFKNVTIITIQKMINEINELENFKGKTTLKFRELCSKALVLLLTIFDSKLV